LKKGLWVGFLIFLCVLVAAIVMLGVQRTYAMIATAGLATKDRVSLVLQLAFFVLGGLGSVLMFVFGKLL
jgi:hypothetical protein